MCGYRAYEPCSQEMNKNRLKGGVYIPSRSRRTILGHCHEWQRILTRQPQREDGLTVIIISTCVTHVQELSQKVGVKLGSELKRRVSWESHNTHTCTHTHTTCTHNAHSHTHAYTHMPCPHTNITICKVELELSFLWHFFVPAPYSAKIPECSHSILSFSCSDREATGEKHPQ